jgi:hypothetical protein
MSQSCQLALYRQQALMRHQLQDDKATTVPTSHPSHRMQLIKAPCPDSMTVHDTMRLARSYVLILSMHLQPHLRATKQAQPKTLGSCPA